MKRRMASVLAVLIVTVLAAVRGVADEYSDRILFADGLYARQMYDLAMKEYAALLKSFPTGASNDAATFRLAECLRLKGDAVTAGRFYSHVVVNFRTSPFRLRAAYRRARLYEDAGDLESAVAHYRVILQENPDAELAAAAQFYLGETLLKKGASDEADAAFAAIGISGKDSEFAVYALMKRAEIRRDRWAALYKAGDPAAPSVGAQALVYFEQALAAAGKGRLAAEALFQSAEIHFRQGNFVKSAEWYRRLLTLYPDDERSSQSLLQAAWSAINAGLYAEALAVAVRALGETARADVHDEWLYIKANSERQLLQYETSIQTYRELLSRFPESRFCGAVRYEMAVSHYKAGVYAEAVAEAEKIRITPELRADVCWLLAESYAALNKPAEATQYYRIVVRETSGSERARDAMYRLAHQLQKQSSFRESSQFYLELVAAYPRDALAPQALFASAFCLAQAGAHDEAVRDWRRLVQEYPAHELAEDGLYQKAMGEVRLGRRTDAATSLVDLRRLFPKSRFLADSWYWQGMMLYEQEKYAEAEQALREAQRAAVRDDLRREAMFQLGLVLQKLDKPEESAKLLQELVTSPLSGKFPPALLEWLASWHGERGDHGRMAAAAALLTQVQEPAWRQVGWVLAGRAHQAAGRGEDAVAAFKAALETGATTHYAAEAALRLGSFALERAETAEADRYFHDASDRASGEGAVAVRARAFMGLGRSALLAGGNEDASRYFMSVAILYDDAVIVPESLFLAAQAFDRLGRKEDRAKVVQELAQRYPDSEWTGKARAAWPN
jgi:TolA-binding protein